MKRELNILNNVRVASPCDVPWSSMKGDDHVRLCDACNKDVFNLSALTREEAERLIIEKRGKLCINYYQRRDGTILTQDCPRGIAKLRKRMLRIAALASAACISFVAAISALAAGPRGARHLSMRWYRPFTDVSLMADEVEQRIRSWLSPKPNPWFPMGQLGGDVAPPVTPPIESLTAAELEELDDFVHSMELVDPQTYGPQGLASKREEFLVLYVLSKPDFAKKKN